MKTLIEFSLLDGGTPVYSMTGNEVRIASALNDYALRFFNPQHDHTRIAGWVLSKTDIQIPLHCYSHAGIGWDVTVGATGGPRMLVMKRHYLYARRDIPHIAEQWKLLWGCDQYREEYLKQLNPNIGKPDVQNYYITTDRPPYNNDGFLLLNLRRDDLLVIRSPEDTETRIYKNGAVDHTSRPFDPVGSTTVYLC
ncbi:MAG: hypothetical protein ACN6OP_10440 [Pseudomonadales bacterium]